MGFYPRELDTIDDHYSRRHHRPHFTWPTRAHFKKPTRAFLTLLIPLVLNNNTLDIPIIVFPQPTLVSLNGGLFRDVSLS